MLKKVARWLRKQFPPSVSTVADNRGGWWPWIREPFTGAWQRNEEWTTDTVLAFHAVYTCITLIANDIGKLRPRIVELDENGIWNETSSPAFSPVLRKPNRFQNHIQFFEWWTTSKLIHGNTYALKERDARGVVARLYLLDPHRVRVLVSTDGSIFYALGQDNLSGIEKTDAVVPASEIIHDRINCLFHPLIGISPIFASGSAANIGLNIQNNSANFFGNGSNPSGILTAPTPIDEQTAKKLSDRWNALYSGKNTGRVAVLGNNLKFEGLRMNAVDSQLIEQLRWTAETVCSTFHVPPFKVGIGPMPTYQNGEVLNQIYYSDCLQSHIEQIELALDEGLGLLEPAGRRVLGVEFDLDDLLRMDSATQIKTLTDGVKGAVYAPNEARRRVNLAPLEGGDTVYMQEQNFSLAALSERDQDKPFARPTPSVDSSPAEPSTSTGSDATTEQLSATMVNLKLRVAAQHRRRETLMRAA